MAGILDTMGIENFYDVASTIDFTRQNLFRVIALGGNRFTTDEMLYMTATTLPGREIYNVKTTFMGLDFNVPGDAKYPGSDSWSVNFRIPQTLSIRRKFEDWSRYIFDDHTSTGAYDTPGRQFDNQIIISLIDKQGNALRNFTLYGAYIRTIDEVKLDITTSGEIMEQGVKLAYQYWRLTS
jgi:hypothetical protein